MGLFYHHASHCHSVKPYELKTLNHSPPPILPTQLPAVPVIDINKLPRYGVLAPPIERPERQAGKHVDLDRATQVFVKNRGALREAAEGKSGAAGSCRARRG